MLTNHMGNRAAVLFAVVVGVGAAVYSGQGRSEQLGQKGQELAIANGRIEGVTTEIAATPIESGKPAIINVDGKPQAAPSGTVVMQTNGQTAQAHSVRPGLAARYEFLAKGNASLAMAKIEAKVIPKQ